MCLTLLQTGAGCRTLIFAIVLHVASNLSGDEVTVCINPEFRMEPTKSESSGISYGRVVDHLIVVKGPSDLTCMY